MRRQAREIATWGDERVREDPGHEHEARAVDGRWSASCRGAGVKLNVTAICTLDQVREVAQALAGGRAVGRLGVRGPHRRHGPRSDPADARGAGDLPGRRNAASSSCGPARASCSTSCRRPRSAATSSRCTPDLLEKLALVGKDLADVQPGDRADVLPRRRGGRVQAVSRRGASSRTPTCDETVTAVRALDAAAIEAVATGPGARARRGRAAVHPRRGRLGGARQPRGQRLPQALRASRPTRRRTTSPS